MVELTDLFHTETLLIDQLHREFTGLEANNHALREDVWRLKRWLRWLRDMSGDHSPCGDPEERVRRVHWACEAALSGEMLKGEKL